MEKMQTLVEKLQQQIKENAPSEDMLVSVQLLYNEIIKNKSNTDINKPGKPFVLTARPLHELKIVSPYNVNSHSETEPDEKTVEVLAVDEEEIEKELNDIKKNAEIKNTFAAQAREDVKIPEKDFQSNLNERLNVARNTPLDDKLNISINESLNENKEELSEKLVQTPIKDLKKAIGVNDRYVFINELFNGDEAMYERSIKTINGFSIFPEAEYWIRRELKLKLGWKDSAAVKDFDQLVRRRFL